MKHLYLIVGSGVFFGFWPLFMKSSGFSGFQGSFLFSLVCTAVILPFAVYEDPAGWTNGQWLFLAIAGLCGGVGLIMFTSGVMKAPKENLGAYFVMMVLVQMAVPACYHAYMNGSASLKHVSGLIAAVIAVLLLS